MSRALVLYAHPVPDSFNAAVHETVVTTLKASGWEVDDFDLYAEGFDPVLSRAEREGYHDVDTNVRPVARQVERLLAAQALVLVFPVWNMGYPAILKGYFDRVFLPGVSFVMRDGVVHPNLTHIRKVAACVTYGGARLRTMLAGDPPRKVVTRTLRYTTQARRLRYLALYDMNRATDARRAAHLARVARAMEGL
ncbi:NAD(P)H dehydrogenase [Defluviimonas sp. 20V17]|uniref:NAD(P)H dehydrogenase (Quinone) n=1 Tax=Allgaiera indica TaxID=765699 RepID=A0AAN4ZZV7_9RHOB|nr:NAD(P)H-dependent oxidoreductase [Allgaiera indica]KDB02040.1 NAD(P)H dehydrogenase [Defluviimonas sp. 20V17]GHE03078.1 NAD(P)H dehydrogenase (quinone) [Allgaiera indica]SDX11827.1 Putative NADPH-quinone reductase (modulator of drug activity B) [Allgaiera indica]